MRNGNERKSSALDCDVGLGLKMPFQPTESYTSCDVGGGGPLFSYTSSRVADCVGDIYQTADTVVLPRTFQYSAFRAPAPGGMSGKALFTEAQWQELERQNMIHKYLSASIPVPHQLLLPSSAASALSQCNIAPSGLELRFGTSGCSDPEPWRCKRTDGKKWRCSRDVAPDQKYCERHAHKTKSRSRKHVEITSHNPPPATFTSTSPISPPIPAAATSYDQTRSIEWFMRGGGSSSSSKQHQWQQQITQIPPDKDKDKAFNRNKNASCLYQPQQDHEDKQGFYVPDTSNLHKHHKMDSSHTTQTTRHFFIDSWEKDIGFDMGLGTKDKKFSPSSLSLSMSGGNSNSNYYKCTSGIGHDQDGENGHLGSVSWMNARSAAAAPGGPLGEALCLGNASATWGGSNNLASPAHGYSNNSNNTNSSSCSKSSCEDGSHALNFIG